MLEMARCLSTDQSENMHLIGNSVTGKSQLATAIAAETCAKGYKVKFFRVAEMVATLSS